MNLENTALVLEGGGLRGVYTSGVLRHFMDRGLWVPYVIGVSMGACNGANYVSRQPERNRIVNIRFVNDKRYLSYARLLLKGELFGFRFIFDDIPNRLVPFDFETFRSNGARFTAVATDFATGEAVYFDKHRSGADMLTVLKASCSMPFLSRPVHYDGKVLLDGGVADSVPIEKSIADGARKHVVVMTRPRGYRKRFSLLTLPLKIKYAGNKRLLRAIVTRPERYNATMDRIDSLEADGKVFTIRPKRTLAASRVERNKEKLHAVYDEGYRDAMNCHEALLEFLET